MTRDERKKAIKMLNDMKVKIDIPKAAKMQKDKNWALDIAIKTLEQEPTVTSTDEPMTMVCPTIVCDDTISREAVLKKIDYEVEHYCKYLEEVDDKRNAQTHVALVSDNIREEVEQLPPIQPKPTECDDCKYKMFTNLYFHTDPEMVEKCDDTIQPSRKGHWITRHPDDIYQNDTYQCSECKRIYDNKTKECPNCGADMRGDTEC